MKQGGRSAADLASFVCLASGKGLKDQEGQAGGRDTRLCQALAWVLIPANQV